MKYFELQYNTVINHFKSIFNQLFNKIIHIHNYDDAGFTSMRSGEMTDKQIIDEIF